ncbi:transcription termination factor Rho [Prosthecobacter fusiformis]|uniref:Transcription termination factor Rho n=1 Tax=Prosthecobacter fusiformis TaxID=48464 RepID=A0A4R7RSQ7_9BACT|nr:transcription termination factor Rho [Prosthecobacter fusiformis]TDU68169.1 transcription termination factor Rho [Prosthecobacter fusiformis]
MNPTDSPEISSEVLTPASEVQPAAVTEAPVSPVPQASTEPASPHDAQPPVASSESQANTEKPSQPTAEPPFPVEISLNDLQDAALADIQTLAETVNFRMNASRSKHQLIYDLLAWMADHRTRVKVDGVLEIGTDNFGLIRYPKYSFAPLPEDVFIPLFLVRKFNLRPGNRITGFARAPKDRDKYLAIDRITEVDGVSIDTWQPPVHFDKLTAMFPNQRIILEMPKPCAASVRIMDLIAPLGKGQRGLINASPRSGKTVLLKDIAKSIVHNHKEISLIILLLDERPEEVTDFEESVSGCEIYSSTFDESPKRHSQLAELVRERACRLVESGKDVVILLDSLTRLARGYNSLGGGKGRTMSGGMDSKAMVKPKKFFGAARNVEEGGSLTIIATALIETENRMDDLIFEEFKGTGNMEATLDREISERRIFPALHVLKSGTRRDDLLYHPDEFKRVSAIRKQLAQVPAVEALELLIRNIGRTSNNAEILLTGLK